MAPKEGMKLPGKDIALNEISRSSRLLVTLLRMLMAVSEARPRQKGAPFFRF